MNRIFLRPIGEKDTDLIVKWRNNEAVKSRFIRQEFTAEMHKNWLKTMVASGKVAQFIIEADGRPIGSVFLRDIDADNKSAEFGIFIGEDDARDKGYGAEAARQIIQFGFSELRLHRIFLRALADNKAAIKSYNKAGFEYEGTARHMVLLNGEYRDVVFMSVINQEV